MCKEAEMLKIAAANAAFFQKTQEINLIKLNYVIKERFLKELDKSSVKI